MITHPDFEELLRLFEENDVHYLIVGGYAVAFHGYPRFTKDIDLFYEKSDQNIAKIRQVLVDFGFSESDLPEDLFQEEGNIIKFGVEPVRIDLLNEIDGVSFQEAEAGSTRGQYGKTKARFIGRVELIANKRSSGRPQDIVDADKLENSPQ